MWWLLLLLVACAAPAQQAVGPSVVASTTLLAQDAAGSTSKVVLFSEEWPVVGVLREPVHATDAFLLLPGGSVTKEGEAALTAVLVDEGFAVLVIDQRGVGETAGPFNSIDQDYTAFLQGGQVTQHLLQADAHNALSYLRGRGYRVWLGGESMGGRVAAVVAANETLAGLLLISTSGYGMQLAGDPARFIATIDPDAHLAAVRAPVLWLHGTNDTMILEEVARASSALVRNGTFTTTSCGHGYCPAMEPAIRAWVR